MGLKASGFASPAQGYEDTAIDFNSLLIRNPPATYFYRLDSGDMADMGLAKGALLVVDRSKIPVLNDLVLIRHEGRFLCRLLVKHDGFPIFTNGMYDISPLTDETEIVGVLTASVQVYNHDFSC
jgi:SOS-response transcriptional repressor LexA